MRYLIINVFIFIPIICFSQYNFTSHNINSKFLLESEVLGIKSISKGPLCKDFQLINEDKQSPQYMLGKSDANRHYMDYSSYGGSFLSSMLFPPAGLVTAIALTLIPPKEENFGLPTEKLSLLKDQNYYLGYTKSVRKKKIWRSWGGFITGTTFFYVGLRMFGYKVEDYLFK